jgi:hypothetical protein
VVRVERSLCKLGGALAVYDARDGCRDFVCSAQKMVFVHAVDYVIAYAYNDATQRNDKDGQQQHDLFAQR